VSGTTKKIVTEDWAVLLIIALVHHCGNPRSLGHLIVADFAEIYVSIYPKNNATAVKAVDLIFAYATLAEVIDRSIRLRVASY
jgi:hypothetical protein